MPARTTKRETATGVPRLRAAVVPHFVAVYVIYHILSIATGSVPAPYDAMSRASWENPSVQEELDAWSDRLTRLGWDVGPDELADHAFRACKWFLECRRAALTPFRDYQRYTGTTQAWSMFVAPHRHPSRLHVDVQRADQDWQPLYIAGSADAAWRSAQLEHIRFRSAIFRFAWPNYRGAYREFAEWLAEQAAADFPDAAAIRVRFFTYTTLSPEAARAGATPQGEFDHVRTFSLDEHR